MPPHPDQEQIRRVFATGKASISDIYIGTISNRPRVGVYAPVVENGSAAYVINVGVDSEQLGNILAAQKLPPDWLVSIVDNRGTISARNRSSGQFVGEKAPPDVLQRLTEIPEGSMYAKTKEGIPALVVFCSSPVTGWRVVSAIPRESLEAPLIRNLSWIGLGLAIVFAASIGLALRVGGRITGSIRALSASAFRLDTGKEVLLPPIHLKEASEAARIIDKASHLLKERNAELQEMNLSLREKERELAEAHRLAKFGTWYLDLKTGEVAASDSILEIYGREIPSFQEMRGTLLPAGVWDEVNEASQEVAPTGSYHVEVQVSHGNGATIWVETKVEAVRDPAGEVIALRGTAQDITDRKSAEAEIHRLNAELEKRVQERTAQLQQSNEALIRSNMELQRFIQAAAHDLQTPLRSIAGFAQLLQQEIHDCTDARAEQWLSLVIENARRLQTLILELLAYSRLDALARPFEPVDMAKVFEQVVAALAFPIAETGAEITSGKLPTVMADRTQMVQLLQNLVENGLKYNRSAPPRISVSWDHRDGKEVFAVQDNGIGIDSRHHGRIFEIFRRLHTHDQIPGTGIGLAICFRIVERHGGRIWVESEPGQGSTFFFSLPSKEIQE